MSCGTSNTARWPGHAGTALYRSLRLANCTLAAVSSAARRSLPCGSQNPAPSARSACQSLRAPLARKVSRIVKWHCDCVAHATSALVTSPAGAAASPLPPHRRSRAVSARSRKRAPGCIGLQLNTLGHRLGNKVVQPKYVGWQEAHRNGRARLPRRRRSAAPAAVIRARPRPWHRGTYRPQPAGPAAPASARARRRPPAGRPWRLQAWRLEPRAGRGRGSWAAPSVTAQTGPQQQLRCRSARTDRRPRRLCRPAQTGPQRKRPCRHRAPLESRPRRSQVGRYHRRACPRAAQTAAKAPAPRAAPASGAVAGVGAPARFARGLRPAAHASAGRGATGRVVPSQASSASGGQSCRRRHRHRSQTSAQ
eukprot:scaffold16964_cov36-Phaeocystis_antarctica.AAC.2